MYVMPSSKLVAILTELAATAGVLVTPKVKLFVNNFTPTANSVIGDFTLGSSNDWAAIVVTWGAAHLTPQGMAELLSQLCTWTWTAGATEGLTAYGYLVTDTAGTGLLFSERFDTPVPQVFNGQQLSLIVRYLLGQ